MVHLLTNYRYLFENIQLFRQISEPILISINFDICLWIELSPKTGKEICYIFIAMYVRA
jgi:hypothetical protein